MKKERAWEKDVVLLKSHGRTPALVAEPNVVVVDSPIIAVSIVVVDLVHREVCLSIVVVATSHQVH